MGWFGDTPMDLHIYRCRCRKLKEIWKDKYSGWGSKMKIVYGNLPSLNN